MTPMVAPCEELYPFGSGKTATKETHPIYFGYMEDYAAQLRKAFEKKRMFSLCHWGASYYFIITRDGQIKDMIVKTPQNDYYNKKVKEIIMSVKPLPFREGMNVDSMGFWVYLGYEHYEELDVSIGAYPNTEKCFTIDVILKK